MAVPCCTSWYSLGIIPALRARRFALVSEQKLEQSCRPAVSTGKLFQAQGVLAGLCFLSCVDGLHELHSFLPVSQTAVGKEHSGEGIAVVPKYYMVQVIRVLTGRMDAWPSSGWSMKQELMFVVHGKAGKDIPCFSPLIVSVMNVLLLNGMQQVRGLLEKVPLRSHSR